MTCEHIMNILDKNCDCLIFVLETFDHDSLRNRCQLKNNTKQGRNVAIQATITDNEHYFFS